MPVKTMVQPTEPDTKITFWPDRKSSRTMNLKGSPDFDFDTLKDRLRELAFLNRGLTILIKDEATTTKKRNSSLKEVSPEYVVWLNVRQRSPASADCNL